MAFEELDDLLNTFAEADRSAMREILTRNNDGAAELARRNTVFKAFVDGDQAAIDKVTAQGPGVPKPGATTPPTPTTPPSPVSSPAFDLAALDARLTSLRTDFETATESRIKTLETKLAEAEQRAVSRAAYLSSEIYEIMDSHRTEFGKNIDRGAFEKYVNDNQGKFTSLRAAHDAFVSEERLENRAKKRADEIVAAHQTSQVPGTSLPTANSPLGQMIRANAKATSPVEQGRGTTLDEAAKAFRNLQTGRAQ